MGYLKTINILPPTNIENLDERQHGIENNFDMLIQVVILSTKLPDTREGALSDVVLALQSENQAETIFRNQAQDERKAYSISPLAVADGKRTRALVVLTKSIDCGLEFAFASS